jgi:hypothetical protein
VIVPDHEDDQITQWQMKGDYRVYKFEEISEARLYINGFSSSVNLTQLIHNPALPLKSSKADYTWKSNKDHYEWWWFMGDYYVFAEWGPGDSELMYIGTFPIWDLESCLNDKKDWILEKGPNKND